MITQLALPMAPSHANLAPFSTEPTDDIKESAASLWETFQDGLPRAAVALGMIMGGWLIAQGVRWVLRQRLRRSRTPSFANVMSRLASWVMVFVSVMLAIAVTFPSVKPVDLLAGLGFFSVAVGFAFQDILENTLSGVLLLFRQPFRSGDQITVVERSGTVTEINIRETRITTFDGESVLIPNRDVYKNVILVHTDHPTHRNEFFVGIAYENDLRQATIAITEALRAVPGVERSPAPVALAHELGVSAVRIRVLFWSSSPRQASLAVIDDAITAVKARLEHDDIEMPANIVALQATPSFGAALQGSEGLTPAGAYRPPQRDDP